MTRHALQGPSSFLFQVLFFQTIHTYQSHDAAVGVVGCRSKEDASVLRGGGVVCASEKVSALLFCSVCGACISISTSARGDEEEKKKTQGAFPSHSFRWEVDLILLTFTLQPPALAAHTGSQRQRVRTTSAKEIPWSQPDPSMLRCVWRRLVCQRGYVFDQNIAFAISRAALRPCACAVTAHECFFPSFIFFFLSIH
jgi:hypothetical protein